MFFCDLVKIFSQARGPFSATKSTKPRAMPPVASPKTATGSIRYLRVIGNMGVVFMYPHYFYLDLRDITVESAALSLSPVGHPCQRALSSMCSLQLVQKSPPPECYCFKISRQNILTAAPVFFKFELRRHFPTQTQN